MAYVLIKTETRNGKPWFIYEDKKAGKELGTEALLAEGSM